MEVVIVKMPLVQYKELQEAHYPGISGWLVKEQYLETEEILEKEREAQMSSQKTKDLYKELHELKHPHKQ